MRNALVGLAATSGALSIGLAPVADIPGYQAFDQATDLPPRTLNWAVLTQDASGAVRQVPLEVQARHLERRRNAGVALLRLPSSAVAADAARAARMAAIPMFAGTGGMPPGAAGRRDGGPAW